MKKQEKIREAYGEHWETVKDYVDLDGWIDFRIAPEYFLRERKFDAIGKYEERLLRPKSLAGIEHNNGWIDGTPFINGYYFIEYINGVCDIKEFEDNSDCINWFKLNVKKHQKINFPKQSIY
jgi:hypothetical protein